MNANLKNALDAYEKISPLLKNIKAGQINVQKIKKMVDPMEKLFPFFQNFPLSKISAYKIEKIHNLLDYFSFYLEKRAVQEKGIEKLKVKIIELKSLISEGQTRLNKKYNLNLETESIFRGTFSEMYISDILGIHVKEDEKELILKMDEFASGRGEVWDIISSINSQRNENLLPKRNCQKPSESKSLKEVFIHEKDFHRALEALQKIKVINNRNQNLIGLKLKGVMQVWVNILKVDRRQLVDITDKDLTVVLNKHFINLNLSEKTDGKHLRNSTNKSAIKRYRTSLLALM